MAALGAANRAEIWANVAAAAFAAMAAYAVCQLRMCKDAPARRRVSRPFEPLEPTIQVFDGGAILKERFVQRLRHQVAGFGLALRQLFELLALLRRERRTHQPRRVSSRKPRTPLNVRENNSLKLS